MDQYWRLWATTNFECVSIRIRDPCGLGYPAARGPSQIQPDCTKSKGLQSDRRDSLPRGGTELNDATGGRIRSINQNPKLEIASKRVTNAICTIELSSLLSLPFFWRYVVDVDQISNWFNSANSNKKWKWSTTVWWATGVNYISFVSAFVANTNERSVICRKYRSKQTELWWCYYNERWKWEIFLLIFVLVQDCSNMFLCYQSFLLCWFLSRMFP